jgi:glycosyltransferase involved in cell wall biosynthesis
MKSILMFAYFFPPEGNAGVYRPLRFTRALASLGWDVRVISAVPCAYHRFDPELLACIPPKVEVIRVRRCDLWQSIQAWKEKKEKSTFAHASLEQSEKIRSAHRAPVRSRLRNVVRKMEAAYYIPDRAMRWIRPALQSAMETCSAMRPDVIWATVGPISSGLAAFQVSQQIHVPYVLDFRDPWGLNYYATDLVRPKFATRKIRSIMSQLFAQAQSIVFLFDAVAECYLQAYPGMIDEKKIHIIPNGFEGSLEEFTLPLSEKCTILYGGILSTYRYDTLLKGLQILKQRQPNVGKRLRLLFVGDGNELLQCEATRVGLSDIIETMEAVSYKEIQEIQRESHAFLILGRPSDVRGHELVAGAKLFGYLKARRPIIGILPQDETRNLLVNVGISTIADVESPSAIALVLQRVLETWTNGSLDTLLPDPAKCEAYSLERQGLALVDALEGKVSEKPFIPGVANIPASLREDMSR